MYEFKLSLKCDTPCSTNFIHDILLNLHSWNHTNNITSYSELQEMESDRQSLWMLILTVNIVWNINLWNEPKMLWATPSWSSDLLVFLQGKHYLSFQYQISKGKMSQKSVGKLYGFHRNIIPLQKPRCIIIGTREHLAHGVQQSMKEWVVVPCQSGRHRD